MNSPLRKKIYYFSRLMFLLLLGLVSLLFLLNPLPAQADSNEQTPVPTLTATPLPSFTPLPAAPAEPDAGTVLNLPVVENTTVEDSSPLPPAEEQAASGPTSFIQSISGVNQCLIGAIVLGLMVITVMVLYYVVQQIRS